MPFTSEDICNWKQYSRSETENINIFWHIVCSAFQQIDNSQSILKKIHFHVKFIKN